MKKLAILLMILVSIKNEPLFFSENSELTMVTSSCGRLDLLQQTLHSFFKYNTYPLKQLIIVDDCFSKQEQIMKVIPQRVSKFKQYIRIHINKQKMGIVGNVNVGMKLVTTKYMLRSEDDWFYHFRSNYIQDSMAVLKQSEEKGLNIVQTLLGRTRRKIRKQELKFTSDGVGYYQSSLIGFNPSIINHQLIFMEVFGGDILPVMRNKYCPDQPDTMSDVCLKQKYYTWLISRTRPEFRGAIVDGDIKQRETTHLGGGKHAGIRYTSAQNVAPIAYGEYQGDPLNQNTLIFHQQKINPIYYIEQQTLEDLNPTKNIKTIKKDKQEIIQKEATSCNLSQITIITLIILMLLNVILLGSMIKIILRAQYSKLPASESKNNQMQEKSLQPQMASMKQ